MIANALRAEIDRYAARARSENPLFCRAKAGTLGPETITRYLANIHRMVGRSRHDFARARDRAKERGLVKLSEHYEHKRVEENGHDSWSANDLDKMARRVRTDGLHDVLPTIAALMHFIDEIIDEDPTNYLAYVLFAEYFLVVLGPEWLDLLEARCNIPRSTMTVIGNHIELDKGHVEEALDSIDDLVADARKLRRMREVLFETFRHFDQFSAEVVGAIDEQSTATSSEHVSAA